MEAGIVTVDKTVKVIMVLYGISLSLWYNLL